MSEQSFHIDVAPRDMLNANDRLHWARKARRTAELRTAAAWSAKNLTPVDRKQHVVVTFHFTNRNRRDVSNWSPTAKAILDGITDAGVWADDNDAWVVGPDLRTGDHLPGRVARVHVSLRDAA